jgi:Tol biopolymer transport system component
MKRTLPSVIVAGLSTAVLFAASAPNSGPPRLLAASSNHTGNWEIYLVHPDTGETKNLTNHKARDTDPAWSPDGKRIAFISDRVGQAEIWVMDADGGNPRPLSAETAGCSGLRWSPDGKRIAFVIEKDGNRDIYTAETSGGKVTRLTDDEFPSGQPAWSPDGSKLAYTYFQERTPKWSLHTMNADGSGTRDIGGPGGGLEAEWSPDGNRIAFVSLRNDEGYRLHTLKPDGTDVRDLHTAASPIANASPRWSPDGKTIAFAEWDFGKKMIQVAVVGADGTGYKVLTSKAPHAHPRWSPDGKSLSYGRFPNPYGTFEDQRPAVLIVSDAGGKNPRELLRGYGSAEWRPQ